jgi:putative addiction module component (TIGR02574 family)
MTSQMDQVLSAALALRDGDRVELVEAILASLRPDDRLPFDESWRPVIVRRSQELQSGSVAGITWDEVKQRARS